MDLDVKSIMLVGVLLSLFTVLLLAQASQGFPPERRRHLRLWTVGLLMQPVAWSLLAATGSLPEVFSLTVGNGLLLLGFAEMARAMRGFVGLPERRLAYWLLIVVTVLLIALFAGVWPHYSARVVVNALCAAVLVGSIALALRPSFRRGGFTAARLTGAFAAFGVVVLAWRFTTHVLEPRVAGNLLDAGPADFAVVTYACVGVVFLSLGFVLMHTERAYEDLRKLASLDPLTGVLTRSGLAENGHRLLSEARRYRRPLAVLLMDMDQFKQVNDSLGHAAGDAVLRHLAERARRVLRGEDVLGRLGGDEFVAMLPSTDAAGARVVAERLRDALREAHALYRGEEVPVDLSIGVAEAGPDESLEALMQRADHAMYGAKRAGGNRVGLAPAP
ncbi:GGDEF domain-containing protein [Arenimonas caeni]|jgi:diguanylate cyclase (GGDEF)-like protein|uniref:diguanylate cyclase n=1 Tax=Arenimonas caeni TaxID=2058085 RepID=A0A2P6M7C3_9GAMM|nr:GGDEF domain-containing protein [Arenimonas caeni]MDY0021202.1 GGDEF domain-containing protein [Arenimonas caeni]PRH81882.1 hypothetical protein C6N40_10315 [Arenimonas caeni]